MRGLRVRIPASAWAGRIESTVQHRLISLEDPEVAIWQCRSVTEVQAHGADDVIPDNVVPDN